jgi:hypothetical protein
VNKGGRLTSNRNHVAAALASNLATNGIKTIVFSENIKFCCSIQKQAAVIENKLPLTPIEADLLSLAFDEIGNAEHVYSPLKNFAGVHHGLLLPSERAAVESAFKRPDGLSVLAATPTLAQGMNLPAEAVILAGDDRWDQDDDDDDEGERSLLPIHDILNAAGRAGRAGQFAQGLVLDVPGHVFSVETKDAHMSFSGMEHSVEIFGKPDQCLHLTDPITQCLDLIHSATEPTETISYFLRRLPSSTAEAGSTIERFFKSTLGSFLASNANNQREHQEQVESAIARRNGLPTVDSPSDWETEIASNFGVTPILIREIVHHIRKLDDSSPTNITALWSWVSDFILANPDCIFEMMDISHSGLRRIFKQKDLSDSEWASSVATALSEAIPAWISGKTLNDIEPILFKYSMRKRKTQNLALARMLALNLSSSVSSACSIFAHVYIAHSKLTGLNPSTPMPLPVFSSCIREGFDDPGKLALQGLLRSKGAASRVRTHQEYLRILAYLPFSTSNASFPDIKRHVYQAALASGLM